MKVKLAGIPISNVNNLRTTFYFNWAFVEISTQLRDLFNFVDRSFSAFKMADRASKCFKNRFRSFFPAIGSRVCFLAISNRC